MPTLLEVIGIDAPATIRGVEQSELHGTSLAYTFADADAPSRHTTQYFEMFGHRSIVPRGLEGGVPLPRARAWPRAPSGVTRSARS